QVAALQSGTPTRYHEPGTRTHRLSRRQARRRGVPGPDHFAGVFVMLTLKLPDGSTKQAAPGTRPRDVAEGIGKRLAQAAVAAKVDGAVVDLDRELPPEGEVSFQVLTDRDREALDVLRHSCAHVMARAVLRLFPGA